MLLKPQIRFGRYSKATKFIIINNTNLEKLNKFGADPDQKAKRRKLFTLCIESRFWGLQYWRVWGSFLWHQMADAEAWQPWVTTLPSGHKSMRSRRRTTYWTITSEVYDAMAASFWEIVEPSSAADDESDVGSLSWYGFDSSPE